MSRAEELRAELRVAELEERLIAAKADGSIEQLPGLKAELRDARRAHREARAAADADLADGDALVRPATVEVVASTNSTGGGVE